MNNKKQYIVLSVYTDSSYNDYYHSYVVEGRSKAVKLANTIIDVFIKNEMLDGWENDSFEKSGNLKTDNEKVVWNEKHQQRVSIMECSIVSDFEIVEARDSYGKYYDVVMNSNA